MTVFSCSHHLFPKSRDISKRLPEAGGKKVYVYQLRDEGKEQPFYVGKGTGNRPWVHFKTKDDSGKTRHIQKQLEDDKLIFVDILEFFDRKEEAFELEKSLIAQWGRRDLETGCLHNLTDGGDTGPSTLGKRMYRNEDGLIAWFAEHPASGWHHHSATRGRICVTDRAGKKSFIEPQNFDPAIHTRSGLITGYRSYMDAQNNLIMIPKSEEPPPGFTMASSVSGKICITNGTINRYINPKDDIPIGFRLGKTGKGTKGMTTLTNGFTTVNIPAGTKLEGYWHPNSKQVYITDGTAKKKLRSGEIIPPGWRIGSPTRAALGRRKITNDVETKWLERGEAIPTGWRYCFNRSTMPLDG